MKRIIFIILIASLLLFVAFNSNDTQSEQMSINKAELTKEEQDILDIVNVGIEPCLWDFTLDDTVKSMTIITYELTNGDWKEISYSCEQFEDLEGRISLVFDNIANGMTIGIQSENKGGSQSYTPDNDINTERMASTTSILSNPYDIVYDKEIPLAIQIHTTKNSISSLNPEYGFEDTENYKDYEKVYAITVTFSQKTVSELDK